MSNVSVEWITFLLHILVVLGSNLGLGTGYATPGKFGTILRLGRLHLPSTSFTIHLLLIIPPFDVITKRDNNNVLNKQQPQ
jgi:hypothetical protein